MGSSGESSAKAIDASVGGLVWVRRRNGSWWPGRILGPDELPQSCSVSPRSGTPVKLLGREDASVDWYNLEKSKRVKAFRCGEYDECIEKAKAAAANSSRKAVKYARREDAIIHALEIENARLGKDHPNFFSRIDKEDGEHHTMEDSHTSSNPHEDGKDLDEELTSSEDNSNSAQELSQSGVSFEAPNHVIISNEQPVCGRRRRTPNDSEDDGTEGSKRMKGLDDLGMGVVSSLKRKRSQVAHVHDFLKRKNRRRPLTKVLESTAMVSVPIMCEQLPSPTGSTLAGVSESKVHGLQSIESGKSSPAVLNNDTDNISVTCGNGKPLNVFGYTHDSSLVKRKQKETEISSIWGLSENGSSDRLFDVPLVTEEKHSAGLSPIMSCTFQKAQGGKLFEKWDLQFRDDKKRMQCKEFTLATVLLLPALEIPTFPRKHMRCDTEAIVKERLRKLQQFVRKMLDAYTDISVFLHDTQSRDTRAFSNLSEILQVLEEFLDIPAQQKEINRRQTAAVLALEDVVVEKDPVSDCKDRTCCICLNDYDSDEDEEEAEVIVDTMVKLPCSHQFHEDCVIEWFNTSTTCPLCRKPAFTEEQWSFDVSIH